MKPEATDILAAFARLYRCSQAGQTGANATDFIQDFRKLLSAAKSEDGEARDSAIRRLREAATGSNGLLVIETHARDLCLIHRVRLSRQGGEAWLFATLGEISPSQEREALGVIFDTFAQSAPVPEHWRANWTKWCVTLADSARCGRSIAPLIRDDTKQILEILEVCARVLSWQGVSLVRFVSCQICGNSKRLERLRSPVEGCLRQITNNEASSLSSFGIEDKPRLVTVRGPLRLIFSEGVFDFGLAHRPVSISESDLLRATTIVCDVQKVLTVENETTFLELAKLPSDTLLIQTSYPGKATISLLNRLSSSLEYWHFGDTDPAGFDILRDLRERTGKPFKPLHMRFRPRENSDLLTPSHSKLINQLLNHPAMTDCHETLTNMQASGQLGDYEQERLGQPTMPHWPYY